MKKIIILGSANFNQKYGIKNNYIKKNEIKELLNFAEKNKIKTIDTSPSYNKSEKIIGSLNNSRFKIISKIPKLPKKIKKKNIQKWLNNKVKKSLKNLKIKKFECLLLHNSNSLLERNGNEIYKSMKNIKKEGLSNKIGISIYDFNTLKKILNKFELNLVQAPLNILDQRLIQTGWLQRLKKRKIEVHVRSVFLQGILLLKYNKLPKKLKKLSKILIIFERWLLKNKYTSLQACISFVFGQKKLDGVIMGCDSKNQLNQILKAKVVKSNFLIPGLKIKNRRLTDPRHWDNF
jgi:aryl-alcohol dehydrogenase-like predicted oxidoreductase